MEVGGRKLKLVELGVGKHILVCATAAGESAEVGVTLESDN